MSSASPEPSRPLLPEDVLPPVSPPNAGFIIKLFVIPAVIVSCVIGVLGILYWLSHMGDDVYGYVDAMERNDEGRWQAAHNLTSALTRSGNEKFRTDPQLLARISRALDNEIAEGSMEPQPLKQRYFLARSLGELHMPEALPPLIKALNTNRDDRERDVRMGAMQGLARLIPNIPDAKPQDNDELFNSLAAAADDKDSVMRYHACYTLAVLDGERAIPLLEKLLHDPNSDVRINTAIGLGRHGDAACIPELVKAIDPQELAEAVAPVEKAQEREHKKMTMLGNALAVSVQLHEKNPKADLKPILDAIDRLLATNPAPAVKLPVEEIRRKLLAPPAPATGTPTATSTGTAATPVPTP